MFAHPITISYNHVKNAMQGSLCESMICAKRKDACSIDSSGYIQSLDDLERLFFFDFQESLIQRAIR